MNKKYILTTAIFTTLLALNPFFVTPLSANTQVQTRSLSMKIVTNLYNRGLEFDAAQEISEAFLDEEDENFLDGLKNLLHGCSIVSEAEILDHIATLALQRKKLDITDYSSLVAMVQKIKNCPLENTTLNELEFVAQKNLQRARYFQKV